MSDRKSDYDIGKGRPPRHSRFKPGQSGNPNGRPKGARSLTSDLADELAERIKVREGGKARTLSKQRALVKALFAKALQGDARSAALLISLMAKVVVDQPAAGDTSPPLAAEDQALLDAFVARQAKAKPRAPADPANPEGKAND